MNEKARKKRCNVCQHKYATAAWKWPRCFYGLDDEDEPARALELSDEFVSNPASSCPAHYWVAVDLPNAQWVFPSRKSICAACEAGRSTTYYEQNFCVGGGIRRVRDSEFMHGPAAYCPLGKWDGLPNVKMVRSKEEKLARAVERQRTGLGLQVHLILKDRPDKDDFLELLVRAGILLPDAARAISAGDIHPHG